MEPQDSVRFFQALNAMSLMFSDEMTIARQKLYWATLSGPLTIEEWEAACLQALTCETFHKVPLPAVLLSYAKQYRDAQQPRSHPLTPEEAWGRLRLTGQRYAKAALADPLTKIVFEAMGGAYATTWGFGNWPAEQEPYKYREFLSHYQALLTDPPASSPVSPALAARPTVDSQAVSYPPMAYQQRNPPHLARWRSMEEDEFVYIPQTDPETAKTRLRTQIEQLRQEESSHGAY